MAKNNPQIIADSGFCRKLKVTTKSIYNDKFN